MPQNLRPAGLVIASVPAGLRARGSDLIRLSLCLPCDILTITMFLIKRV